MLPIPTKKFNANQDRKYKNYCVECINNGLKPEPQKRYFYKLSINYGFVYQNNFNEIFWRKRKKDFNI